MLTCKCGYASTRNANMKRHRDACCEWRDMEILRLQSENSKLTRECEELRQRSTVVNNYNNNSVHVNQSVNILAYGQEPLPDAQDVLDILLPPEHSVARYVALKHFRHPQHANLRICNKRSKTMQVVEPDVNNHLRWTEKDRRETIEKLVDDNLDELTETHGANRIDRWRQWYKLSGLEDPGYDKTDAFRRMHQDVENMLLSQRNTRLH